MAKECIVCGSEIALFSRKINLLDGYCCEQCWLNAGFDASVESILSSEHFSSKEIIKIKEARKQNEELICSFKPTKVIKHAVGRVEFDDESRTFIVVDTRYKEEKKDLFHYNQIDRHYLVKNTSRSLSGDSGRASVGGGLFGSGGAVVGAMSNMKIKSSSSGMKIELILKNCYVDKAYIFFTDSPLSHSGIGYRKAKIAIDAVNEQLNRAYSIALDDLTAEFERRQQERRTELERRNKEIEAAFEQEKKKRAEKKARIERESQEIDRRMEERRKRRAEQIKNGEASDSGSGFSVRVRVREVDSDEKKEDSKTLSAADEIRQYKQLFDDGIITEEEFQAKKKQLLGL